MNVFLAQQSFWQAHGNEISAAITMLIAVVIAITVDRFVFGQAEKAASKVDTEVFSREARTRLRLFRRLLFFLIIAFGVALALSQFDEIKRLATGVLASTAVLGLIVGFAARQVIANMVAGVIVAVNQPVRIGDLAIIEEHQGRIADIGLTYTEIETEGGRRVMVPNEKLTTNVLVNQSTGSAGAPAVVSVTVPPAIDLPAARRALEGAGVRKVKLTGLTHDAAQIEVSAERDIAKSRLAQEFELREAVQDALRQAGLLAEPA